jgi:monofunctional biosynthetic peptidoglycan transglycosylase
VRVLVTLVGLYLAWELLTIPYLDIARLERENPGETALMRQRLEEAREEGRALTIVHRWIPLSRLPAHTLKAVVVAEDGMFYDHGGVDWFEVQESIERNLREGKAARGASTITQQLAKNLYLSTSKTPMRKIREAIITFLLESRLSKRRILELYVNVIEWGRGVFGIDAASRLYFGKSASGLTLEESARMAAVIPSPLTHRPDAESRYVLRRQQMILARMQGRTDLAPRDTAGETGGE